MSDDTQATDATFDAEPTVPETPTAIVETPAQAPEKKKFGRGARSEKAAKPVKATRARKAAKVEESVASAPVVAAETVAKAAKAAKAAKPAKATRARKAGKSDEAVAPPPAPEEVAKTARKGKLASTVKSAKPAKPTKAVAPVKVAKSAGTAKRAKAETTTEAATTAKPTKVAKSSKKVAKAAPATAAKKAAPVATGKEARYTTNELNSVVRKAGLTVEFTPLATKPANIGRGPAKEFKVDMMVAHLRGSNGDLIRDRGPGTPLYNDAESLAAVEIFEKFRSRTFHNKLKVEIL
jgi:hypothetical protein